MRIIALCLTVALTAPTLFAQDLDQVMDSYLEARGGIERLREIDTVSASGRALMGGGVEFPFRYLWKRPDKFRFELVIQGTPEVQAFDGTTAWEHSPNETPEPTLMSPMDLALLNDAVDFLSPMIDAAEKGHTVKVLGTEEFEGTEVVKLQVTKASGFVEYSLLDSEYHLEIAQQEFYNMDGQVVMLETIWGDYKEIGGVMLPSSWQRRPQGGPPEITLMFEKMEVDTEIPDATFAMPSGE